MGKFLRVGTAGINFKLPWLDQIAGRKDQLVGKLQDRYGYAKDRAEREVDAICAWPRRAAPSRVAELEEDRAFEGWLPHVHEGGVRRDPSVRRGAEKQRSSPVFPASWRPAEPASLIFPSLTRSDVFIFPAP